MSMFEAPDLAKKFNSHVALAERAAQILAVRNAKYPPEMRCAGSIFKNLILAELPARVARGAVNESTHGEAQAGIAPWVSARKRSHGSSPGAGQANTSSTSTPARTAHASAG